MITVLTCRGTGEKWNSSLNMLTQVTKQLPWDRFRVIDIQHPATLGPVGGGPFDPSELETVRVGVENLEREVSVAPGPVVTLGYSLGGVITTEHLRRGTDGGKVIMSGSIANPCRKAGKSYGRPSVGEGIFGAAVDDRRQWAEIANPADVITSMPFGSPLRHGSDLIQAMSLADPLGWARNVKANLPRIMQELLDGNVWRLADPAFIDSFVKAGLMLDGYARGGTHTTAYGEKQWFDWQGKPISGIDLLARAVRNVRE